VKGLSFITSKDDQKIPIKRSSHEEFGDTASRQTCFFLYLNCSEFGKGIPTT